MDIAYSYTKHKSKYILNTYYKIQFDMCNIFKYEVNIHMFINRKIVVTLLLHLLINM